MHRNEGLIQTINNQLKDRPKQLKTGNPNFPYLENKLAECSDTHTVRKTFRRMVNKLERTVKQRKGAGYYQTLMVNNEHRP